MFYRYVVTIAAIVLLAGGTVAGPTAASAQTPGVPQAAPAGTTGAQVGDRTMQPTGEQIVPVQTEPTSVTSSDPSVVTVDSNYSSLTNTWSLDYQCKKAGVAVVTITWKDGTKGAVVVGCGVSFPLQTVDYTKGMYNSKSYMGWTDAKGTLTVKGVYTMDGKDQTFQLTVPGYAKAATAPAPVKIAPGLPTKTTDDHGD
ncbi:MAG: hypothetical protein ACYDAB_02995 [bacterium]